jgi:hypothetical protein
MPISPTKHTASQADGSTRLEACGEVHIVLSRGDKKFPIEALVVKNLDSDILVGIPFMKANKIVLNIPNDQIIIQGKEVITYTNPGYQNATPQIRRSQSYLLRAPAHTIIHAGEFIELNKPEGLSDDVDIAVEPRCDSPKPAWPPPAITQSVAGTIRIPNRTSEPIVIKKNQHLAQIRYTYDCKAQ